MLARYGKIIIVTLAIIGIGAAWFFFTKKPPVDFTTQVKPIINQRCITCHGGVKQKAGFSLLFREEALAKTRSGKPAIIPGDADNSEVIRRVTLNDPEERMPYMHDPLSSEDIDIIRRWINEGAKWGEHWAYEPVKQVTVPKLKSFFNLIDKESSWALNPVDHFIEQKLVENKLAPSSPADRHTILRRVSLDITGLPPSEGLAQKFLGGKKDSDYAGLVDSLLASPHFGEKWTSMWMDLARYADTKGYEKDDARNIWKYRDWLIKAFNEDKPYDSFLIEQIAGDLMPNPTDAELIATAFHRNSMTNDEGGTDNEEFRTSAVIDRVNTTWDATMGTTFSCVQCHSHPYDPFKHDEYYKFMAFFNNSRDEDTQDDYPLLRHYNDTLKQELHKVVKWVEKEDPSPAKAKEVATFLKTWQPAYNTMVCDSFINSALGDPTWIEFRNNALVRMRNANLDNHEDLIFRYTASFGGGTWRIHLDKPDGEVIATIPLSETKDGERWKIERTKLKRTPGRHTLYFRYTNPNLVNSIRTGARIDWLTFTDPLPGREKAGYQQVENTFWKLLRAKVPTTPVMMENPEYMRRATFVFDRGNWLVKGAKVEPGVPGSLSPFPPNVPKNRLGLSMWLTSKQNPLTARAMVNRVWEQLFGRGLAETLEDMGSQGIPPTHPELLDWLSYQFMHEYNWSVKKLIRTLVMSATYQQDSKMTAEMLEKDPENKYYARSSRIRLSAEQVRDQALSMSGKLNDEMYGPSVYPYQPKGLWLSPYNGKDWVTSKGEDQYRRAVYTYWKRSAPYPSMVTFDGVARDVCTSRRIRTNTPLQALTILNDSAYIDLARHFTYRMQNEGGTEIKKQIERGYQLATYHPIDGKSLAAFLELYAIAHKRFNDDTEKARALLGGKSTSDDAKTAAMIVVANAMMNLDEVVMRN